MTLEDALRGLKNYWKRRPDGGTRVELIALARAQGFEEPLLNGWLDVFLQGFQDQGRIVSTSYSELAAVVATVGVERAAIAAESVFLYLVRPGATLDRVRKQDRVRNLTTQIADLAAQVQALAAATAVATEALKAHTHRDLFATILQTGTNQLLRAYDSAVSQKDHLVQELS